MENISKIKHNIAKQDTNIRKSISPSEKLAVTLRFLGTGNIELQLLIIILLFFNILNYYNHFPIYSNCLSSNL